MAVIPQLPLGGIPQLDTDPANPTPIVPPPSAIDGSPALRPGDPDPVTAPADDREPIFSTDPLA